MGAIAHEQHGGALSPLHEEPVLDLSLRELEDLLDADGHLGGLRARDPQAPLGEQGVHALAVDNHVRRNRVVARADAHDRAGAVLDELPRRIGYIFLDDFGRTKPAFLNSTGVMYPSVECILKLLYQCT